MTDTLYTFKEICDQAGIPYSTGRFYRDKHSDFMYSVGTGRNKRYTNVTAEVLHFIGNAYKTGASATEVQDRLSRSYPVNQAEDQEVSQCSVTMQRNANNDIGNAIAPLALIAKHLTEQQQAFLEVLEGIRMELNRGHEREEALERVNDAIHQATRTTEEARASTTKRDMEITFLDAEMKRLKKELQDIQERQNRRWWQKLFKG